jgi:hypothetical protein
MKSNKTQIVKLIESYEKINPSTVKFIYGGVVQLSSISRGKLIHSAIDLSEPEAKWVNVLNKFLINSGKSDSLKFSLRLSVRFLSELSSKSMLITCTRNLMDNQSVTTFTPGVTDSGDIIVHYELSNQKLLQFRTLMNPSYISRIFGVNFELQNSFMIFLNSFEITHSIIHYNNRVEFK